MLKWLEGTDFFKAPASTKYHGAHEGGLCEHSLNVYRFFYQEILQRASEFSGLKCLDTDTEEMVAICALLHDVCKVNKYVLHTRNIKNEATGQWEKVTYYSVGENKFPYGHGEGSVWLIERFMRLSVEESIIIRWHMGGFDDAAKGYDLSAAFRQYPNAMLLHIADMKATYLLDR
ncbi:MAG: hydrolase [Ruminococcus sp.]|nr:hydrolase [Ruminococcus sp.]